MCLNKDAVVIDGEQQQVGDQSGYGGSSTDTPNYWTPPPPTTTQWPQPDEPSPSAATPSTHEPVVTPDYYDSNRSEVGSALPLLCFSLCLTFIIDTGCLIFTVHILMAWSQLHFVFLC